jgi:hypothetical protein
VSTSSKGRVAAVNKVRLIARALDRAAEVFLIDSRLDMVDRGIGHLDTSQPPGVYKVKVRAGQSFHEQLVVLDKEDVHLTLEHLHIPSAIPLDLTAQTHEYHRDAAVRESRTARVTLGAGSSIFVFARDWTPENVPSASSHHPAEKLELRSLKGEKLVDFEKKSAVQRREDPCAACRVDLAPGAYKLVVTAATDETFEMTVIAQPGWQTQVFLLQRDTSQFGRGRRPDLGSASVVMSQKYEFNESAVDNRLAELAKLALVNGRQVTDQMPEILDGKYDNPMVGIFGGHLLLRQRDKIDPWLLKTVVSNLRRLFGKAPHPDVEALALEAGLTPKCDFATPPMLQAGWRIVVEHSLTKPRLVPADSLAARIATRITNQDPWLIWRGTAKPQKNGPDDFLDDIEEFLKASHEALKQALVATAAADNKPSHTSPLQRLMQQSQNILMASPKLTRASIGKLLDLTASAARTSSQVDQLAKYLAPALKLPPATLSHLITQAGKHAKKPKR